MNAHLESIHLQHEEVVAICGIKRSPIEKTELLFRSYADPSTQEIHEQYCLTPKFTSSSHSVLTCKTKQEGGRYREFVYRSSFADGENSSVTSSCQSRAFARPFLDSQNPQISSCYSYLTIGLAVSSLFGLGMQLKSGVFRKESSFILENSAGKEKLRSLAKEVKLRKQPESLASAAYDVGGALPLAQIPESAETFFSETGEKYILARNPTSGKLEAYLLLEDLLHPYLVSAQDFNSKDLQVLAKNSTSLFPLVHRVLLRNEIRPIETESEEWRSETLLYKNTVPSENEPSWLELLSLNEVFQNHKQAFVEKIKSRTSFYPPKPESGLDFLAYLEASGVHEDFSLYSFEKVLLKPELNSSKHAIQLLRQELKTPSNSGFKRLGAKLYYLSKGTKFFREQILNDFNLNLEHLVQRRVELLLAQEDLASALSHLLPPPKSGKIPSFIKWLQTQPTLLRRTKLFTANALSLATIHAPVYLPIDDLLLTRNIFEKGAVQARKNSWSETYPSLQKKYGFLLGLRFAVEPVTKAYSAFVLYLLGRYFFEQYWTLDSAGKTFKVKRKDAIRYTKEHWDRKKAEEQALQSKKESYEIDHGTIDSTTPEGMAWYKHWRKYFAEEPDSYFQP